MRLSALLATIVFAPIADASSIYTTADGSTQFRCVGSDTIEVSLVGESQPSFSLAESVSGCDFTVSDVEGVTSLSNGDLVARIKDDGRAEFFYQGDQLVAVDRLIKRDSARSVSFTTDVDETLMGAGSRVLPSNLKGHKLPLYNRAHYGYGLESSQMYYSMPMLYSSKGYYFIFDNAGKGEIDIATSTKERVTFSSEGGRGGYIVVAGDDWNDRLENLTEVTGRQPMPPRWALGSFASRFGYRNRAEAQRTVEAYHNSNIGLDAIVLDLYWFGHEIKGHMGKLEFDLNAFDAPKDMIEGWNKQGVKTVLITEPFVLTNTDNFKEAKRAQALATNGSGEAKTYDFYFGNTSLVDVFSAEGREWFEGKYSDLVDYGVAGWWGDLGEPEVHPDDTHHHGGTALDLHNAYGHRWAQMVYEWSLKARPDIRPFVLMRSGFVGSQRYGMIPWSGDVGRNWQGLAAQPQIMLEMGMQGIAYMHSDLGGFTPAESLDEELYTRWLQFGVFTPVFRPHGEESVASEPVYHSAKVKRLAKESVDLRYSLMPYLYTMVAKNHRTGVPLARPMAVNFSEFDFDVRDQYMWGDALLVKPVLEQGAKQLSVQLPEGRWYDFHSSTRYQGSAVHSVELTESNIPVFVKAGSVIPRVAPFKNLDHYNLDDLKLHYYATGSDHTLSDSVYHDDGISIASRDQSVVYQVDETELKIDVMASNYRGNLTWHIHGVPAVESIKACDRSLEFTQTATTLTVTQPKGCRLSINYSPMTSDRVHVYQMLPRVFANHNTTNAEWGTIKQNGSGKLDDITSEALASIKAMGTTHVWYTGIAHHALATDYQEFGISLDDPDVVKGRAGSPYAVKDYFNINPDLANDVANRLSEFDALIKRTHDAGMKVIIDIVPNHVARSYEPISAPDPKWRMGANDDTSKAYAKHNNFYYMPQSSFEVPTWPEHYQPLNGDKHPKVDAKFDEVPAKVTGNGAAKPKPDFNDWYETVKVNYGVKPDGEFDFKPLPSGLENASCNETTAYWASQELPNSWYQFEAIAHYWLARGVDGFRYDMAEMVPAQFWNFLNCSIKTRYPDAFLLAEVYQPELYDEYINIGRMSALYDKVGFYDQLKKVMRSEADATSIYTVFEDQDSRQNFMLHFLENHDEQRLAHPEFAGRASQGRPAAAVSALMGGAPNLTYFAQELGEAALDDAGFGKASRTTIFDYWGLPSVQRWRSGGSYNCRDCLSSERALQQFYQWLMPMAAAEPFVSGTLIKASVVSDNAAVFAFARAHGDTVRLVVANFSTSAVVEKVKVELNGRVVTKEVSLQPDSVVVTAL